jgi:hypothetical protein
MTQSKGLSQVLSVIVAASVLMMLGLTLTVMGQGSLADLFSDSQKNSCIETVKTKCSVAEDDSIATPGSCKRAVSDSGTSYSDFMPSDYYSGDSVTCPDS